MKHQKEIQKAVQDHINKTHKLEEARDACFKELQQEYKENNEGGIPCSWDALLENLKERNEMDKYKKYYKRKIELDSKLEILHELGSELAKAGFWKQD